MMNKAVRLATFMFIFTLSAAFAQTVAVLTPYLASATTKIMVDEFRAALEAEDYTVNIIDTAGDVAALDSRIQDVVTQGVDAIVLSVNPELVSAGLAGASEAGIPVFGLDAGSTQGLVLDGVFRQFSAEVIRTC
jgi:ribose transport system substrate-binding protein